MSEKTNSWIWKQAAIDNLNDIKSMYSGARSKGLDLAIDALKQMPPCPEFYCQKCKYYADEFPYKLGDVEATGHNICFWNRVYPMKVDPDFFCGHFDPKYESGE